jgi:hypothetical protein
MSSQGTHDNIEQIRVIGLTQFLLKRGARPKNQWDDLFLIDHHLPCTTSGVWDGS